MRSLQWALPRCSHVFLATGRVSAGRQGRRGPVWCSSRGQSAQTRVEAISLAAAAAVQASTERARQVEQQASQSIAQQRERADAAITDLNRRHARAIDRVRHQAGNSGRDLPNRAAAQPSDCAGAVIPERDGVVVVADQQADQRWLLDLARDADITRVALTACREQYETVRSHGQ